MKLSSNLENYDNSIDKVLQSSNFKWKLLNWISGCRYIYTNIYRLLALSVD